MLVVTKHTILSCDVILAEFISLYQHPKGVPALPLNIPFSWNGSSTCLPLALDFRRVAGAEIGELVVKL